jgi:acetyltransferase-like isoleucine patch superfamily enzyme
MKFIEFYKRSSGMLLFYLFNYWVTYIPIHLFRIWYLRNLMNIEIGKGAFVHMGCLFYENVVIGENSVIGRSCHLLGNIVIGNNVSITAQTYIFSSSHDKDSPKFEAYTKAVVISDRAWIGARAVICPGIRIGTGAILGANSTATKDIPDFEVFAGTPARRIGLRSRDLFYKLKYAPFLQ